MKWLVRGDCHGNFTWINNINKEFYSPEDTGIILLGDAGFNFFLNKSDEKIKRLVNEYGYKIYCVRGNHEQRPQLIPNMKCKYDYNVDGMIFIEDEYSNICYFRDFGIYTINNYKCAVIGGAYSVDKWYRLARGNFTEETNIPSKSGWFNDEQLTEDERFECENKMAGRTFDFVFSHTCPIIYQPTDLFLGFVNQSKVDNSMEIWMDKLRQNMNWSIWLFGHYHADRIEAPYVEQYFNDIEDLDTIWQRWDHYSLTGELDWWLNKSPNFLMGRDSY